MTDNRMEFINFEEPGVFNMPYTPAIRVLGGLPVYLAGVTAAPVYHSHPHVPEEFDGIPEGADLQAEMTVDNLESVLQAAGGDLSDIVEVTRYIVDIRPQPGRDQSGPGSPVRVASSGNHNS